jgi:hypothetical protein
MRNIRYKWTFLLLNTICSIYKCQEEVGNKTKGIKKYIIVLNVPNSTHGNSVVSLPRKPRNIKLSIKNHEILRAISLSLFDKQTLVSITGKAYNITTDNANAQIPIVLFNIERNMA